MSPGSVLSAGDTLGHYRVEGSLGRGGMGEVYRAHDSKLGRRVALKVLPLEVAADPERLQRFRQEARALASLNHPNIVMVHSVETASVQPASSEEGVAPPVDRPVDFMTMEIVEGKPLAAEMAGRGMSLERIFGIAIPIADALAAAHEAGIIHRDLKPANVMLDRRGRPKILDFGLAKSLQPPTGDQESSESPTAAIETSAGVVLGTRGYMSPEQIKGESVDARSDLFALGLLLYEMATGKQAFASDSAAEYLSAVLRDMPDEIELRRPDLPHHLSRVVRRCLEKDPERRYQSAKDVRNELEDLAREMDTVVAVESAAGAALEVPRRRFWPIVVGAIGLLLVAGIVAHRLVRRGFEGPPEPAIRKVQSLAVLPFSNLMNDPEQDYFVEGMHEALITDLSKIGALRVISRTSAMRYRETEKSLPEIAEELDVDALIEGSVLRADGMVRVTAQLIDGKTDRHLWAESYDRELENVLALLSEVAQAIANEVEVAVTPEQVSRLTREVEVDPAAHDAYLRGIYALNRFRPNGYREALEHFNQAISMQPDFADAWARLAGVHLLLGGFGIEDREQQEALATAAANRALELDSRAQVAQAVLGWIRLYFHWDWEGAATAFERALELSPYEPYSNHGYADYLTVIGRGEEGLGYLKRAASADPLSPMVNAPVAGHELFMRHYEAAVALSRQFLELNPDYPAVRSFLAEALWHQGRRDEALAEFRVMWSKDAEAMAALERGAEASPARALAELAALLAARERGGRGGPLRVADYYALGEEAEEALYWLERAYDQRVPQLMLIRQQPAFDLLHADHRFIDLSRRIGIPE